MSSAQRGVGSLLLDDHPKPDARTTIMLTETSCTNNLDDQTVIKNSPQLAVASGQAQTAASKNDPIDKSAAQKAEGVYYKGTSIPVNGWFHPCKCDVCRFSEGFRHLQMACAP